MKILFFLSCFFLSAALFAQENDLIVPAGTNITLSPTQRILTLNKLSLGDNSIVTIPSSMDGWTVTAKDVSIGNNVKIVGLFPNVNAGRAGVNAAALAYNCFTGIKGGDGLMGQAGFAGKNVSLNLKIRSIGTLVISSSGTSGGNGGAGGKGGKGGTGSCSCSGGTGGTGGNGGKGGNGGNGGTVTVVYSKIGKADVSNSNFVIQNGGGPGGVGGSGGSGGPGGSAGACATSKASAEGKEGKEGTGGARGIDGQPGRIGNTTVRAQ